ncbi:MAG TPA: hypothetical protein VK501_00780 [Baekduia sp.]|uniref:hypothetical protein n=1 Tax=Baekduia sp. TaxID=2600305 RepID=UPI002B972F4C|nr:hypothetical protein [Baekduia sp.]HMJ32421.1 hypothetical protein [Baekduia sp.]
MRIKGAFEPAAEELDPDVYDHDDACPLCGTQRVQARDLTLDLRRVPKRGGFAQTLADERIVDQHVADLLADEEFTGVSLRPVHHRTATGDETIDPKRFPAGRELLARAEAEVIRPGSWRYFVWLNRPEQQELRDALHAQAAAEHGRRAARRPPPPPWYQLVPDGDRAQIAPTTLVGITPFADAAQNESSRCPQGHVAGLNLISELHLDAATYPAPDLVATEQLVGVRRGLLQPVPLLVMSPRLRGLLVEHGIKGWETEVAYLD